MFVLHAKYYENILKRVITESQKMLDAGHFRNDTGKLFKGQSLFLHKETYFLVLGCCKILR
jgi:hypothetical protein